MTHWSSFSYFLGLALSLSQTDRAREVQIDICLSDSVCLSACLFVYISLSPTHTHTRVRTHTHTRTHSVTARKMFASHVKSLFPQFVMVSRTRCSYTVRCDLPFTATSVYFPDHKGLLESLNYSLRAVTPIQSASYLLYSYTRYRALTSARSKNCKITSRHS